MTYYEWIRRCLISDAEKHPIPKVCKRKLHKTIRKSRRDRQIS